MTHRTRLVLATIAWSFAGHAAGDVAPTHTPAPWVTASAAERPAPGIEAYRFTSHQRTGIYEEAVVLGFHEHLGAAAIRLGMAFADNDRRVDLGFAGERLTVNLFSGSATSYGRLEPGGLQVDPFFFHGGSRDDFAYRGAAADVAIGRAVSLQFALAEIEARQLDDRQTAYAGISTRHATAGVFQVARDNDVTAGGVMLSWSSRAGSMSLRQIDHESGARYRALGFSRVTDRGRRIGLTLRSGRNPLYRAGDESRILFQVSGLLGAATPDALAAAETVENGDAPAPDDPSQAKSARTRNLALLGGALVGIGVAASSGSDGKDERVRIQGRNNAARQVLNQINPVSVRQNREHGGWIYRNADGTFGYTEPVAGTLASVDIGPKSVVPGGTTASASYHTHGGPDPRFDNENFSPADLLSDIVQQVDGYLGTPAGFMKLHDFRSGDISVLGRINN